MSDSLNTPEGILRAIKDSKIQTIDLRLTDLPGRWQRIAVPPSILERDTFENGIEVSSSTCLQEISANGMRLIPDPTSAFLDPFSETPTLVLIAVNRDPLTGKGDPRDPRSIAQKAEAYVQTSQIGDTANFGLELFVCGQDVGTIVATLADIGIQATAHEAETGGRAGIAMPFAPLTRAADKLMIGRYVAGTVARRRGVTATFVPAPLSVDDGSGLNVHQSIWHRGQPLFAGDGYAGSSALMRHYMAGLLEHEAALLAICAPTPDSYRGPPPDPGPRANRGNLERDRAGACCIPTYAPSPKAKRVEFRSPDPSCNPYLAFAAMLMAGIDGFENRLYSLDPDQPIGHPYDLPLAELSKPPSTPGSLEESLDALAADHAFLVRGDVFTPDIIAAHLRYVQTR
ncbi:MAG TPA: glutamine synthetase beta-grasp domain-containing protein [Acidisphaera sp.]|nr:glutamine synthetase beta-grasp domain-containing protein [Acidisphaera sp.]